MGVGTPLDLLEAVHRGVDMFDLHHPEQGRPVRHRLHFARHPPAAPFDL
jgi:tRNA-guanine family transglycosylase